MSGPYGIDRGMLAHRRAWENVYGPVPPGMIVHHVCENPACIEATHLVAVTCLEHRKIHPVVGYDRRAPKLTAEQINAALEQAGHNRAQAARALGISRPTLYRYLAKL